ncbi:hypothetical protein [Sphingomonas aracearum]|uniref:Uncharacterized protein n=1 Tax=Sphingomonas aracearum TaxID=2283317 RepID=A0A369VZ25_9SPHN|nr:hypothetical protein [Sphingomonas aracearum]RDE06370.1 hypothetical protein DVW87_01180 [Sphingomonas aracearum]
MHRLLAAAVLLATPALAGAQAGQARNSQAESGQPPQRIRSVQLTPGQACPKGSADEVVVCSTVDPDEQFRIPQPLRNTEPTSAEKQSWVNRAETIDQVGREAGGLPNTCSPVGSGGQTGCVQRLLRDAADAKRNARIENARP